ncbi:hypothetical protein ANCDUO_06026 [Ancylostoma duodenale]|uniref:Uncharacterized protein n=1 Tax=Ancylostoma duodenale TaxID=51022 RepID=A0A0C2GX76_9BILA|nr:hypothetical protein ANCDUO_06026 [Ancylostoma duodenale]
MFNFAVQQFTQQFYAANLLLAQVTGDIFHMDPCQLPHNCLPLERYDDKANRVTYQPGKSEERSWENSLVEDTATEEEHLRGDTCHSEYFIDYLPLKMARDNGLSALIADGIYKLNPITTPDRMNKGQLYCVQAVVRGGVEEAISVAREAFEEASIEGCAFHLAQDWNRMSKGLGLRRFVRRQKGLGQQLGGEKF